jgi:hypothetical protein
MLVSEQTRVVLAICILRGLYTRSDILLQMPLESTLDLRLDRSSLLEHDDSVGLDEHPQVQHGDQDAGPSGQDDRDEIWGERVEFAQIAGL